jgi:hypothetical protein
MPPYHMTVTAYLGRDLVSFPGGEGVDGCVKLP